MPTPKALEKVDRAKQKMQTAEKDLRDFLKTTQHRYTSREIARRKRLASRFRQCMEHYMESVLRAAQS